MDTPAVATDLENALDLEALDDDAQFWAGLMPVEDADGSEDALPFAEDYGSTCGC